VGALRSANAGRSRGGSRREWTARSLKHSIAGGSAEGETGCALPADCFKTRSSLTQRWGPRAALGPRARMGMDSIGGLRLVPEALGEIGCLAILSI